MQKLEQLLRETDHKGYPAYKSLKGSYGFPFFTLAIDHVQGDPFAAPSSLSIHISAAQHGIPKEDYQEKHRRIMLQDYLLRGFYRELGKYSHRAKGSGKSGMLSVSACGQEVLERSALTISPKDGMMIVRFQAGFPAAGRTTLAMELRKMLVEYVPACAAKALRYCALDHAELERWIRLSDEQRSLREQLKTQGLVAFVADGSVLPRKSGVDERPMKDGVAIKSPEEDCVEMELPDGRKLRGLGVKKGITLIVGGGYHGKSTLLEALQRGIYDHIPGDGREYVVTDADAVKIRSEDGRSVKRLDISAFICNLPNGKDTTCFSTEDASGSTSQAANTVEAVLSGAHTLLIDEDTSATNFMVRDALMQQVIHPKQEPIIPFLSRMRSLYEDFGVSTILVAGSSGAFFQTADRILQMKEYQPYDITDMAKAAAERTGTEKPTEAEGSMEGLRRKDTRIPEPNREVTDSRKVKVRSNGTDSVSLNHESVELRYVEQIIDNEQTNLLGLLLRRLEERYFDGRKSLAEHVESLCRELSEKGFAAAVDGVPGNLAMVRPQEVWAMINRYRGLQFK